MVRSGVWVVVVDRRAGMKWVVVVDRRAGMNWVLGRGWVVVVVGSWLGCGRGGSDDDFFEWVCFGGFQIGGMVF